MSGDEDSVDQSTLDARVQAQREQIFKAMSILECCKLATASLYEQQNQESMVPALAAAYELLDAVGWALDDVASELKKLTPAQPKGKRSSHARNRKTATRPRPIHAAVAR
jgi:hypothetical protein